jgi:hypothetical protein
MEELPNLSSKVETNPKIYKSKKWLKNIGCYIYNKHKTPSYFPLDSLLK